MNVISGLINYVTNTFASISAVDVIDILLVTVLFFYLYLFIRERRSGKLAVGVVIVIALFFISEWLQMNAMRFILQNIMQVGIILLVIVFQPELRSLLEKAGGNPIKGFSRMVEHRDGGERAANIAIICKTVGDFAATFTGALLVFQRTTRLGDIVRTGTVLDARISEFLLKNIFFDKSPLHDGAVIIVDNRIYAGGCFLPLSTNTDIIRDLGTRHRAAIGMSENSDAVVLVVSEQTGRISIALDGKLRLGLTVEQVRGELLQLLEQKRQAPQKAKAKG